MTRYTFPPAPSHYPAGLVLLIASLCLSLASAVSAGCGPLSPGAATALEVADEVACGALTLIPVAGGELAAACAAEEGNVKAALTRATIGASSGATTNAGSVAIASAPMLAAAPVITPAAGESPAQACARINAVPLYHRHGRRLVHAGCAPAHLADVAQASLALRAALEDLADGGPAATSSTSSPATSAAVALPSVYTPASDAGGGG